MRGETAGNDKLRVEGSDLANLDAATKEQPYVPHDANYSSSASVSNDLQASYVEVMSTLLVVHHSPTPLLKAINDAVIAGATHDAITGVDVRVIHALEATLDDVLAADAYILGTATNFGYISGALKHFFDVTFNAVREETEKRPFSYWIHGGYDTTGAERAMESITTGLGWKLAAEPLIFLGEMLPEHEEKAEELGGTLAALIS